MDWVPIVLLIFKFSVLGLGMFFAIKWHYDRDRKLLNPTLIKQIGKLVAIIGLAFIVLLFAADALLDVLGLDFTFLS